MAWRGFFAVCLAAVLGVWGCSDLKDGAVGPVSPGTQQPLVYATDIQPIFQQNCASCHSGGNAKAGYALSSFSGVFGPGSDDVPNAIPGNALSVLITILEAPSHAPLAGSPANVAALRKWVVEDSLGLHQPNVHPDGWMDADSPGFHGKDVANNAWDMSGCRSCHGEDYTGGVALKACTTCHVGTPEDCSTCHGSGVNPAPPMDLSGNFVASARGVGAHQVHLAGGNLADGMACSGCHGVP